MKREPDAWLFKMMIGSHLSSLLCSTKKPDGFEALQLEPLRIAKGFPLAWQPPMRRNNNLWVAETPIGDYVIGFDDGWHATNELLRWEWEPDSDPRSYSGPGAAQQAAQAHFDSVVEQLLC